MKRSAFLWKYEKYFFLLIVIVSLIPLLSNKFFPTIDGPAHLHNANLLRHIWFHHNTALLQFYDLNSQLNSNLINHVWFAFCGLFLPSYLVEKSILIFYVLTLPYSFRFLTRHLAAAEHSPKLTAYLIFPFIYTFPFCLGFFNFCIGIPLLFWTIGLWLKSKNDHRKRITLLLSVLSTLVYLSHVFNFLLLGFILFFVILRDAYHNRKTKLKLNTLFRPAIVFLPGLLLLLTFVLNNNRFKHDPARYLSREKLIETIVDIGPIITLNRDNEIGFSHIIFYSICFIVVFAIVKNIRKRKEEKTKRNLFWFALSLVSLGIYFVFPDWLSSGGFISIRLALFFFLMILIWIASVELPPIQLLLPVLTIVAAHVFFVRYHNQETEKLSIDAVEATSAESIMEENTVLLPLNYSNNWIHINYGCYVVTEKPIVVLDNYEATKPHFPLLWKKGESVYDLMEHYGDRNPPCINIENYEKTTKHKIDYISRWAFNGDNSDSCSIQNSKIIAEHFALIYESPQKRLQLFKRKN